MSLKKKVTKLVLLASLTSLTIGGTALAAVQYPDGNDSVWTYGSRNDWFNFFAFSNYYHGKKIIHRL